MAISSGKTKTKCLEASKTWKTYRFPLGITHVLLSNSGKSNVDLAFDAEFRIDNFEVGVGRELPVFDVEGGSTEMKFRCSGDGELQLLMWG